MINPDNAVSQESFESKVNTVLKSLTRDNNGKLNFPEGTPEEVVFAATAEQRRRDTQAEYTKSKQTQAALKAEKEELLKQVTKNVKLELTSEQAEELEELKLSDPDAWRSKLNSYESETLNKRSEDINNRLKEVSAKGIETAELENRKLILEEFMSNNPGFVINDDIISNDVPPRITNKLKNNEITFKEFLKDVRDYLKSDKVVATTEKVLNQPNLSKAGGNDNPSNDAVSKESNMLYRTEIY